MRHAISEGATRSSVSDFCIIAVTMTQLLQKAFDSASALSEPDQDAIASTILIELESDRRWEQLLGKSSDLLDRLAADAINEHRAGATRPLSDSIPGA